MYPILLLTKKYHNIILLISYYISLLKKVRYNSTIFNIISYLIITLEFCSIFREASESGKLHPQVKYPYHCSKINDQTLY